MTGINLGNVVGNRVVGISSGLDSDAIIKELASVRQKPIDAINTKLDLNKSKVTQYSSLNTLLNTLKSSLNYLRKPTGIGSQASNIFEYRTATASSSNLTSSNYLTVTANPGALVGSSNIQIGQLAKALELRSSSFNARDVDVTGGTTGASFTAGTFQIGSSIVSSVSGATKTGFTLASADYSVKGAGTGIVTADGIKNITVTGASGGQSLLEGKISGFTGAIAGSNAIFNININGIAYTSNAVDVTQTVDTTHQGIAAGTTITFTANSGGVNETSFQLITAADVTVDDTAANITSFTTALNSGVSGQSILQARSIANFTDANVKSPLTGLTNNNIKFSSNGYAVDGTFGSISGFKVQKSTGSDGAITVTVNGEDFRSTGLGSTLSSNLTLKSTTSDKELKINLADAGISVNIGTDANATALERSFDYAFGSRALTNITVNSGDTLNDVIYSINTKAAVTGASSSVIKVSDLDYRFNLKANNEGITNKFDIFDTGGVLTGTGINGTPTQAAQDAKVTIDGVELTRSSNNITDAITNVTLNLLTTTPNYGANTDTVNIKVENDIDTIVTGVKGFLDAYNAVRVFYSQQNERDSDGAYTEKAILGGDQTLQSLVNLLSAKINSTVPNTSSSNFSSLGNLGITLKDYDGDSENIATKNILTYDDTTLTNALKQNFSQVREVFEFNFTSSSNSVALYKSSNNYTLDKFKLDIDTTRPAGQEVKLLDSSGSPVLDSNGAQTYLTLSANKITGPAGSPVDGLEFLYGGDGTDVIDISLSQGIGDSLYNLADTYVKDDGVIGKTIDNITDQTTTSKTEITKLQQRLSDYVLRLQDQFASLERAISSVNNVLLLLDANTNAQNARN